MTGLVSKALEQELRRFIQRHGIALWLDAESTYTPFVDNLAQRRESGQLPYDVCAFRGSYLELMLALESLAGGSSPSPLLVHLPGLHQETVKATPLLELWEAGKRFQKALDTLVKEAAAGHALPDAITAFLNSDNLTLHTADTWLDSVQRTGAGGFAAHLNALDLHPVIDDLLSAGPVSQHLQHDADAAILWDRLTAWTGLSSDWRDLALSADTPRPKDVAFVVCSWALCVEYTDDLKRPPVNPLLLPISNLPGPLITACRELAAHLRTEHPAFYSRTADETEALLSDEIEAARAEDLGKIDTFRFEEAKVLTAALDALEQEQWSTAQEWAKLRIEGDSFWLRDDPSHRSAWLLVIDAARLGQTIVEASAHLNAPSGLEEAIDRYTEAGATVDQAHRHLEQRRLALLLTELPHFETLRTRLDAMRSVWTRWANAWAKDFNALCLAHGFLPPASHQQRTLFDDVVRPLARERGTTVLFAVDALRYEMAEELYRALKNTSATTIHLKARLAELPTITAVGMNVLAPVASSGKLQPIVNKGTIESFASGEFRVKDPDTRKRAMQTRVGGGTCPWLSLDDVVERDATSLKKSVARANLLIVHSREIDIAAESGLGPAVFDHVMQKLRAAWRLLREAGVRRFVFTADHGFLLLDAPQIQTHGRHQDSKRRYAISSVGANHTGEVRVALGDLGYEAEEHLMMPETTAVFETGLPFPGFVHGGNSLQERVIPVLTLVHRAAAGGNTQRYGLQAEVLQGVAGMHCIQAAVHIVANRELNFGGAPEVELALRVPDMPDVHVELCQTRGHARLAAGTVSARVGESFELFFRLSGNTDAKVRVELHHPSAMEEVEPCTIDARFTVSPGRNAPAPVKPDFEKEPSQQKVKALPRDTWLEELPVGVRGLFAHIEEHGTLNEREASQMLGSARKLRRFARNFEDYAARAPFNVQIHVVSGIKQFVREGGV